MLLLGGININLEPKDKELFRQKSVNTINKEIPYLFSLFKIYS